MIGQEVRKNMGKVRAFSLPTAQNGYSGRFKKDPKGPKKRGSEEIVFLSKAERERLFAVVDNPRDRAMFQIAIYHGLRASEVGRLRLSDYNERERRIYVRRLKDSISGQYPLFDDELRSLRAYLKVRNPRARPDAIFLSRNNRAISRRRLDELVKYYFALAGIPPEKAHMHVFKHTCCTMFTEDGWDVRRVQDWVGHVNIQNTAKYSHITNVLREQMAAQAFGGRR
jgi:type 1 fimbriae regulatory protein FimB